jgi:oxygen-independent coproporphyrinogen-3 oxidase
VKNTRICRNNPENCYTFPVNKIAGLYIHIPFCERKCTYCNFNTTDFAGDLATRYINAVVQEVSYWGQKLENDNPSIKSNDGESKTKVQAGNDTGQSAKDGRQNPRPFVDTIYFGGGTPSIIEAEQLAEILEACRGNFHLAKDAEITIEINPATLSRQKMEGWLAAGINRASVGVQSFLNRELVSLSRTHNTSQARQTLAALREAGFDNLSLDLIAGLPEQTKADWQHNLREALALRPEHLSLYLLEVKEGTQLYGQIKRKLRPQPDEDLAAEMYEMICEATAAAGYEQYEISNFALCAKGQKKSLRSQHNLKYWSDAPFYGLGCGAHSYDGRRRWVNTLKTETYIEQVTAQGCAIQERRELDDTERATEAIFMALRLTEGVHLEDFHAEYGLHILREYGAELERLAEGCLIKIEGGRLRLTPRGRLLSNEVFMIFV